MENERWNRVCQDAIDRALSDAFDMKWSYQRYITQHWRTTGRDSQLWEEDAFRCAIAHMAFVAQANAIRGLMEQYVI